MHHCAQHRTAFRNPIMLTQPNTPKQSIQRATNSTQYQGQKVDYQCHRNNFALCGFLERNNQLLLILEFAIHFFRCFVHFRLKPIMNERAGQWVGRLGQDTKKHIETFLIYEARGFIIEILPHHLSPVCATPSLVSIGGMHWELWGLVQRSLRCDDRVIGIEIVPMQWLLCFRIRGERQPSQQNVLSFNFSYLSSKCQTFQQKDEDE